MKYRVHHETRYRFGVPVSGGHQRLNLRPRELSDQHVLSSEIVVDPPPSFRVDRTDTFGNHTTYVELEGTHAALRFTSTSVVDVEATGELAEESLAWEAVRDRIWHGATSPEELDAMRFAVASPYVPLDRAISRYALASFTAGRPIAEAAMDLTLRIHRDFSFEPQATSVSTPVREVFEQRRGVCQDFAHLTLVCLRGIGLPARYVSGYLRTDPPEGKPRLMGADASHAWVSLFAGDAGWLDLDPTNGCTRSERHVRIGWGRDFGDVSPIKGNVVGAGDDELEVAVDVVPA